MDVGMDVDMFVDFATERNGGVGWRSGGVTDATEQNRAERERGEGRGERGERGERGAHHIYVYMYGCLVGGEEVGGILMYMCHSTHLNKTWLR